MIQFVIVIVYRLVEPQIMYDYSLTVICLFQMLEEDIVIALVCDGCNWGRRPMEASNAGML